MICLFVFRTLGTVLWTQHFLQKLSTFEKSNKMKLLSIFALCARAAIQVPGIFRLNFRFVREKSGFNSCFFFEQFRLCGFFTIWVLTDLEFLIWRSKLGPKSPPEISRLYFWANKRFQQMFYLKWNENWKLFRSPFSKDQRPLPLSKITCFYVGFATGSLTKFL